MSKYLSDRMMVREEPRPEPRPVAPNRLPCPRCGSLQTRVRRTFGTVRYRECARCKHPFKTVETA